MNLILTRNKFRSDGVFGDLTEDNGKLVAYTLEHGYSNGNAFVPKLPDGNYSCRRGAHKLEHMTSNFETFEVENVPGHTNILFHVGNYNRDSDGCILLGTEIKDSCPQANTTLMVANSKVAFASFMKLMAGVNEFSLSVRTET